MPPARGPSRTKAQQRAETTSALVRAARGLFAENGYARTSLAQIVTAAGVTKGALYHHFAGKADVFRAVLGEVHREVAGQIAAAAPDADPWTQLVTGCRAFLVASTAPGVQQIMLLDAPSVLGWSEWRDLDAATSRQQLAYVLDMLIRAGTVAEQPVAPLTELLSGAMNEAALWLAQSENLDRDLEATMIALTRFLESLRW